MKKIAFCVFLVCNGFMAQTPCENGFAGSFPCEGYDLVSQIPLSVFNSVKANDSWGWTDPLDQKEYAIICLNEGTAFIDISDPINPVYLGQLPGESSEHTTWRDVKVYANYAFIVSEDSNHGMQVFDLTRLRNVANPPEAFTNDAYYNAFGSAHNIAINEATGYAYVLGTATFSGGPHFIDIQDPLNPTPAGGFADEGYTHDAQIVVYNGHEGDYAGREILFAANETRIVIADVTDKNDPLFIASIAYSNVSYTHQGWLTEDQKYFILGDESDEIDFGINSRSLVFNVEDLDNPEFYFAYSGPTGATDHNGYVKGTKFYLANNAAGLRVVDISDIDSATMVQEGFFDSYPTNNSAGFNGSWNVYPFFESGHIVISDRAQGFMLVKASEVLGSEGVGEMVPFGLTPNPVTDKLQIASNSGEIQKITILDISGKTIIEIKGSSTNLLELELSGIASGIYFVSINDTAVYKIIKN